MSDRTPTQRIEAAIVRLEGMKNESMPGPWRHLRDADSDLGFGPITESLVTDGVDDAVLDWGSGVREPDAALIVALHATVGAQLAILTRFSEYPNRELEEPVMALADAIISGGTE